MYTDGTRMNAVQRATRSFESSSPSAIYLSRLLPIEDITACPSVD